MTKYRASDEMPKEDQIALGKLLSQLVHDHSGGGLAATTAMVREENSLIWLARHGQLPEAVRPTTASSTSSLPTRKP